MNQIDTLILSGGGPSSISYIGIFKALFEKNILTLKYAVSYILSKLKMTHHFYSKIND